VAAGWTETGGGVLIALGLATPLAAAGLSAVMITALRTALWKEGIKPATGEHPVLLATAALALPETGPGSPSIDSALGLERRGTVWTLAALGAGAAGSAMAISKGREQPAAPRPSRAGRGAGDTPSAAGTRGEHDLVFRLAGMRTWWGSRMTANTRVWDR
jgi:putative oxidoreductase